LLEKLIHRANRHFIKEVDRMQDSQISDEKKIVLFVDDEEMVLKVGSLMLRKLGYTVLTASEGQKAIEILKKNRVAFIILDMAMPGMNGYEIYHRLKKIQPKIKILLASGYVGDQSEKRLISIGFDGFIQKPFDSKQLSEKIEDILIN
jgi:two-component system cell cycle sensor histidine kinase/response regulator CckA